MYCPKCGKEILDDSIFCSECGTKIKFDEYNNENQANNENQDNNSDNHYNMNNNSYSTNNNYNGNDRTMDFDREDIEQNKIFALFSYISWLVIIPLFATKNSRFAKFHANQGLVLLIGSLILKAGSSITNGISIGFSNLLNFQYGFNFFNILGSGGIVRVIILIIIQILQIVIFVLCIMGIINAINGKAKELPIIGKIHIIQ